MRARATRPSRRAGSNDRSRCCSKSSSKPSPSPSQSTEHQQNPCRQQAAEGAAHEMDDHPAGPDCTKQQEFRGEIAAANLLDEQCQEFEYGEPIEFAAPRISPAKPIR